MIGLGLSINTANRTLATQVSAIFRGNGYNGFMYDVNDISTLNQVSTGTTPVTAVTQPIGKMSDKSGNSNHAIQATAAARPTWQVDASGYHLARFLGTDDSLSCATGGGGSAGFLFCASFKPTGGGGTYRILFSDIGTNTGYNVRLGVSNQLVIGAGDGAAVTTKSSTAAIDVGVTQYGMVWDDGADLNVQVGGGVIESRPRPVVVSGPGGFTVGKEQGPASGFFPGDIYRAVYIRNSGLTASQRAAIQAWVKAGAGL